MNTHPHPPSSNPLVEYLLRIGDDRLVLGHRTSEWCGHGPMLEEDIALANIALDLVGAANHLLTLASKVDGSGRSEDDLAFLRDAQAYRCCALVEQPNGDYGYTIARHALFSAYSIALFEKLSSSRHDDLAGIAGKSLKESHYHFRHCSEWLIRLGDGTEESHRRAQQAVDGLWRFTGELFVTDAVERTLHEQGLAPLSSDLRVRWEELIDPILQEATIAKPPADTWMLPPSRNGLHTEHLGHLLAEMQSVARAYPGARW